jgi:hypothetical protein
VTGSSRWPLRTCGAASDALCGGLSRRVCRPVSGTPSAAGPTAYGSAPDPPVPWNSRRGGVPIFIPRRGDRVTRRAVAELFALTSLVRVRGLVSVRGAGPRACAEPWPFACTVARSRLVGNVLGGLPSPVAVRSDVPGCARSYLHDRPATPTGFTTLSVTSSLGSPDVRRPCGPEWRESLLPAPHFWLVRGVHRPLPGACCGADGGATGLGHTIAFPTHCVHSGVSRS